MVVLLTSLVKIFNPVIIFIIQITATVNHPFQVLADNIFFLCWIPYSLFLLGYLFAVFLFVSRISLHAQGARSLYIIFKNLFAVVCISNTSTQS